MSIALIHMLKEERRTSKTMASAIIANHTRIVTVWVTHKREVCIHCGAGRMVEPLADEIDHKDGCMVRLAENTMARLENVK